MAFVVDTMSTSHFARHFFKAFDVPSNINKKAKWITSSSPSSPPAEIAEAVVDTSFEAAREQDVRSNGCWQATCVRSVVSTLLVNELFFLHYDIHRSTSVSQ